MRVLGRNDQSLITPKRVYTRWVSHGEPGLSMALIAITPYSFANREERQLVPANNNTAGC